MAPSTTTAEDGGGGGYLRSTTNFVARLADVQGPGRVEMRGRVSEQESIDLSSMCVCVFPCV